ncbi:MAG: hypothetical protein KKA19_02245 [Candidatus Margulisbacteria bacterium]|nr:hypothetical protein [Candidatus Margulisiibacteriota bacterium]
MSEKEINQEIELNNMRYYLRKMLAKVETDLNKLEWCSSQQIEWEENTGITRN